MRILSLIAITCLSVYLTKLANKPAAQNETVSQRMEYVNGGPDFNELHKTFTYRYTIDNNKEIILLFDSTNISKGENYKFVEFLQMVPLLPLNYTFNVKVNTSRKLKNGAVYKDFYIYNFKVKYEAKSI